MVTQSSCGITRGGRSGLGIGPAKGIARHGVGETEAVSSNASTTYESVREVGRIHEGSVGDRTGGDIPGVN